MSVPSPALVGPPCWADLTTSDLPGARAFYGPLLGWDFEDRGPDFGHYHMASLRGRTVAGAGPLQGPPGAPPRWTVYLHTANLDAALARVQALGGSVLAPATHIPGQGRLAVISDPTGAAVGIWQPAGHLGFATQGAPGGFAWCEVNTRDAAACVGFFETLTGMSSRRMDGMAYWSLQDASDETHFGVLQMTAEWGELPPHWMAYFAVASADRTAEQVRALGGTVHYGPFDSPYGRILVCADPQGAAVTFIELPPQTPAPPS